jgi:transmembrane sensor
VRRLLAQSDTNVVPLQNGAIERSPTRKTNRFGWRLGVAAAVALIAASTLFVQWTDFGARHYATDRGEQRIFKLPDGSLIHLNTQTRAQVRYGEHARIVELTKGEALFAVAQDTARPFRVIAGGAVIEAIGTQFNVYRHSTSTRVAVVEGRVRVSAEGAEPSSLPDSPQTVAPGSALLAAGEGARVDREGAITVEVAAVNQATAWRQRLLQFDETTLAQAAAEFNRYNTMQIHVQGEEIRGLRVTGFFNVDNPEGLLRFLDKDRSLDIMRDGQNVTIRAR